MRKTITAAAVAASLAAGGLVGAAVGTPGLAGAAETTSGAVGWVQDALRGLVDDGTIDQAQADAVASALREARPERRAAHHRFGGRLGLGSGVAEALGVSGEELRTALMDGRTLADVAAEQGVEVEVVVDAIVAAEREHLDEEVADGDLTRAEADELLADAEERATAVVKGEVPHLRSRWRGPFGPGWSGGPGRDDRPHNDDTSA